MYHADGNCLPVPPHDAGVFAQTLELRAAPSRDAEEGVSVSNPRKGGFEIATRNCFAHPTHVHLNRAGVHANRSAAEEAAVGLLNYFEPGVRQLHFVKVLFSLLRISLWKGEWADAIGFYLCTQTISRSQEF